MANHKLSLDIPDTLNECMLPIIDTSIYTDLIPASCPQLQIATPGFTKSEFVDNVSINFNGKFTACELKVQTVNCTKESNALPDGIYVIRWSVSPNDIVYVEYNHLRITQALLKIRKLYCDLDLSTCAPSAQVEKQMRLIQDINTYLQAAKAKVEVCRQADKGLQLYKYAMSKLDKLNCKLC